MTVPNPSKLDRASKLLRAMGCILIPDRGRKIGSAWLHPHSSSFRRYYHPGSGQVFDVSPHCVHIHRFPNQTFGQASMTSTDSWLEEMEAKTKGG